ncbi:MAG: N-acetylglutaminylglutamine amidotransferase [Legionella sp.]|nr:N-acetylglutaminylglutamine amidotransferase [Legionella sp.]
MCGIAGYYKFKEDFQDTGLLKALEKLHARGPDAQGLYITDSVGLAHKRLKIFDLSDKAAQPMVDKELGIVLVFNGEIYNFLELRKELEAKSYNFYSNSDSEVLIKAYHAWNLDFIHRIEGMFAFAIYEIQSGNLILGRDRLGIKPLYYAYSPKGFQFASTLPALLKFKEINTALDEIALHYYFTFHAIPEPHTLLKGAKKLEPGILMLISKSGTLKKIPYWTLDQNNKKNDFEEEDWVQATRVALDSAIQRQLKADVPIGVLLSGGLDSSILVALAAQNNDFPLETFSIGFETINNNSGDEFTYSDLIAKQFRTKHHQINISNDHLEEALTHCVDAMSEPMTSHDNIGFYLLSKEVSKYVKVVLSGQGADELFAGYHWFQNLNQLSPSYRHSSQCILECIADNSYSEYCQLIHSEYQTTNYAHEYLFDLFKKHESLNLLDNMLVYESGFALSSGPLSRVDNMTMASSLEARVPFLDELVVSVASSMPNDFKIKHDGKFILKQLGRALLPESIINRPKGYFPVPALQHTHGPMHHFMKEILNEEAIRSRGIYKLDAVQKLLNKEQSCITATGGSKLWQIALLEYWLQRHLNQ